jgi:ribosomal protein L37E
MERRQSENFCNVGTVRGRAVIVSSVSGFDTNSSRVFVRTLIAKPYVTGWEKRTQRVYVQRIIQPRHIRTVATNAANAEADAIFRREHLGENTFSLPCWTGEPFPSGYETVDKIGTPIFCLLPPRPLQWDESVAPCGVSPSDYYCGMARTVEPMSNAEKKELADLWNAKIKSGQSDSLDLLETDSHCPRCGSQSFNSEDFCNDCGQVFWKLRFGKKESRQDDSGSHGVKPRKGKGNAVITPEEFIVSIRALHTEGLGYYIQTHEKEWHSLVNSYRQLCEGLLPRDIAAETGEKVRTIESRKERLLKALREFAASNRPLPRISDVEKHYLLSLLGVQQDSPTPIADRRLQPIPQAILPERIRKS